MASILVSRLRATLASLPAELTIPAPGLAAVFTLIPDPRRHARVTYPVAAVLRLVVAALLANHPSVLASAEWGRRQQRDRLPQLGFSASSTPCPATLQRLGRRLDPAAVAAAVRTHVAAAAPAPEERGAPGVASDGTAPRGRLPYQGARTRAGAVRSTR